MSCSGVTQPCKEVELKCPEGQVIVGGEAYTGVGSRNYIYTISNIKCAKSGSNKTENVDFKPLQFNSQLFNKVQLPTLQGGYSNINYFQQSDGQKTPSDQRASQISFSNDLVSTTPIGSNQNPKIDQSAKQCDPYRCWNPTNVYVGPWSGVNFKCSKGKSLNRIRYAYREDKSNQLPPGDVFNNLYAWSIINFKFDESDCIENTTDVGQDPVFDPIPIYIPPSDINIINKNGGSVNSNGSTVEVILPTTNGTALVIFSIMLIITMIILTLLFFFARA